VSSLLFCSLAIFLVHWFLYCNFALRMLAQPCDSLSLSVFLWAKCPSGTC
jgi:hypothetical protein